MRKIIISSCLSVFCSLFVNAQDLNDQIIRQIIDSTKKALNNAKGNNRVDCLNLLAESYFSIWDEDDTQLDTAYRYADEALKLAKNTGYKKGSGYALLWKASYYAGRTDRNRDNNNTEVNYNETYNYANKAIQLSEEIKDYRLAGDVYDMLKWLERWRGDPIKFKYNVEKAIYYYEKPVPGKLSGHLTISQCDQCQGNEGQLGWLYMLLSGFESTSIPARIAYVNKAIAYYQKTGSKLDQAQAHMNAGNMLLQNQDYASLEHFKLAIPLFHAVGNEKGELKAFTSLVSSYWNLGDFENGLYYSNDNIKLADRVAHKYSGKPVKSVELAQAYFWTGRVYSIAGDYEAALSFMRKARNYYPEEENWISHWSIAMGDFHRLSGNYDSALYYITPFEKKGNVIAKMWLSTVYLSMQEYDKALGLINESFKTAEERSDKLYYGRLNANAAKVYFAKNNYEKAMLYARSAFNVFQRMKRNLDLTDHYKLLSDIHYKLGNSDSAYTYLKKYTSLKDSLFNRQLYIRLNNYKKEAEEANRTSQIKLLQKDNMIKAQLLQAGLLRKQQQETQLALLDKSNEIKDQELLIKDQRIREQTLLKEQNQTELILLDKENRLKDQQLKQQATFRNALLGGLLLFLLLAVFVYRNLSLKRKNERLSTEKGRAELQQKVAELEMQALRAQMNPHFIFNCLSSINRFIFKNDNKVASDYLTRFSRLIRMVLMHSQKKHIPLEDELEMIRIYLDLERLRFKDAFDYSITTTNIADPGTVFIPPLLLQPFCENAVWHGLMHKEEKGHLNLVISEVINGDEKTLQCIIEDDGVGREKAAAMNSKSAGKEKSLGLKITKERLALLNREDNFRTFYQIEDIVNDKHEVAGTRVRLKLKHKETTEEYAG